jgi:hypothetical protein
MRLRAGAFALNPQNSDAAGQAQKHSDDNPKAKRDKAPAFARGLLVVPKSSMSDHEYPRRSVIFAASIGFALTRADASTGARL